MAALSFSKVVIASLVYLITVGTSLVGCSDGHTLNHNAPDSTLPAWGYKCASNEGCQRVRKPWFAANDTVYPNLALCWTACGPFGGLWPKPVNAVLSSQFLKIHPNYFRYDLSSVPAEAKELLVEMTRIVTNNLHLECGGNVTEIADTPVVFVFTVSSPDISLSWQTNEQYVLDLHHKDNQIFIQIIAHTIYGVRHGLETFSQLVSANRPDYTNQKSCGLLVVSGAKIRDLPVFKHRGLLLDTSRNFLPMDVIKRMIDGMAATKMNVFHWHATDSHSFPLESTRVPQFTRYGAYSAAEVYKVDAVKELINYAKARGVRVVIEIDAPAHAGNGWQWGTEYGYGDLAVCVAAQPWRQYCIQPPCGQLNPANPATYRMLRELYRDIAEMLPKPSLLHMGGDEVFIPCWSSNDEITTYMREKGYNLTREGFIQLWGEFHATALQIWDEELKAAGGDTDQPVMLWSSELTQASRITKYLNKDRYVIEVWEKVGTLLLEDLIRLGYRVISVPKDIWYLDHGFWGVTTYSNWRKMYAHIIPQENSVLGGEVAMWGEFIDGQGIDSRIWPRAAAVAERLWSNPNTPVNSAEPRLQNLRNKLISRGLRPDVLSPAWCQQNSNKCQ